MTSPRAQSPSTKTASGIPLRVNTLTGTGEMAEVFRTHEWSATQLGPVESWSETLTGAVNSLLNSPFASAIFWGADLILLYNDGYRAFLGGKHPTALGIPARASWEEVWETVSPSLEAAFQRGTTTNVQNLLIPILVDGRLEDRYWTYCFYPLYERGRIAGVAQIAFDSTSEVTATRRLRESEARATRVLQSIGDAVIVTDTETRVTRMNPVAEALTGWTIGEAEGRALTEVFHIVNEATRVAVESPADKVRRMGTVVGLANHTILIRKDGSETPIDDSGAPIRDEQGTLAGIVLIFRDITERRRAEEALRSSEDRVRLALSAANGVGTWDWDVPNDLVYADTNFARLYGVDPQRAAVGVTLEEFVHNVHPEDRERVGAAIADAMRTGDQFASEYRLLQADGAVRWVLAVGRCSHAPDGTPQRFPGVTVDITERKQADEVLRAIETRFRIALETAQLGSWELEMSTGRMECSSTCKANYGRMPEERFDYKDLQATVHPDDRAAMQSAVKQAIAGDSVYRAEYRVVWPDGTLHWIIVSGGITQREAGSPVRMVGVSLDVTERHRAAAALMQSEKLAAVGRLAASIAHEINNPLESVTNLLYLARDSMDSAEIHSYLDIAERELRRVSAISNQTLRFYKQSTSPKEVSCGELFESVLSVYQGRIVNARVQVEKRKRATLSVLCFDGEIRQVLNNLVGNAIDALGPEGGRLLIRSRNATHWSSDEKGIALTIADSGTGMPPEVRRKIFEPFFTTKGIGGNGLGLWVSQEIVARHRGALRVRSSQRKGSSGTVFTLFLPFAAMSR